MYPTATPRDDTTDALHETGLGSSPAAVTGAATDDRANAPQPPNRSQGRLQAPQPQPAQSVQAQEEAQAKKAQTQTQIQAATRATDENDPASPARVSPRPAEESVPPSENAFPAIDKGIDQDALQQQQQPMATDSLASTIEALQQRLHLEQDGLASPRHELELIPEDQPISSPHSAGSEAAPLLPPNSILTSSGSHSNRASATSTPDTGIQRPSALRLVAHPLPSRPSTRSPITPTSPIEPPLSPTIIRTASTNSVLRHPAPDINARSGSYTSNIAALEATAERFSMTSSIEDAIRDAHNELKRSDSRRSSILAASVRSAGDHTTDSPQVLSQSSIVGLNNAARTGGYSPGGYIMSPTQSLTGCLRSASKSSGPLSRANSTRSKPETIDGEAFPNLSSGSFMSRDGPGKGSTRSVRSVRSVHSVHSTHSVHSNRSGPLSLAEIAEMEPPATLTLDAMDEADRTAPKLEDLGDDEHTILARAHQHVDPDATDIHVAETAAQYPSNNGQEETVMLEHYAGDSYWDNHGDVDVQLRNPANPPPDRVRDEYEPPVDLHQHEHGAYGTPDTVDEDNVFADFDGMHCDPDSVAENFPIPQQQEDELPQPRPRPAQQRRTTTARPQSYFDPETNQQMLYYPARVPAMLNLPPKLGKGMKAAQAARTARRSQVLSQMPKAARESRFWLPDPLEKEEGSTDLLGVDLTPSSGNLLGDDVTPSSAHSSSRDLGRDHALATLQGPGMASHENSPLDSPDLHNLRRPAKLGGSAARQSRMNLADLPPQLRASVFFDLPTESPKLEVKNGSAMDTLDSILDAAASAPVNAFTDHAFAGHLGAEVYGHEKRKSSRKSQLMVPEAAGNAKGHRLSKSASTTLAVPDTEKRKSVWSLLPGRSKSRSSVNLLNAQDEDARSKLSASVGDEDSPSDVDEHSALAPDEDERGSGSGSEDGEQVYTGPPTTLLAELQMRKQQHKNRTRNPLHQGIGLHSTLLELDAVAQMEAGQRKKKKVNLAWAADHSDADSDDEDDEDIPLGLLAAKKQLGPEATDRDMAIALQEMSRPLGLMEKRDQDDNEPLSRRRDRLQGKPVPVSMYLQPNGNGTRLSVMPGGSNKDPVSPLRMVHPLSASASATGGQDGAEEEVEGETLGERMRRLRAEDEANPLPRARPVSTAFSEELLGEWGVDEAAEKKKKEEEEAKKNAVPPAEEEETLGQRRRRLQAEREAREKEMGIRVVSGGSQKETVSRRLSLAGVLGANPLEGPQGNMDPREVERRRKEEEAARAAREQEVKMRAFRAQIPTNLTDPRGGVVQPGGYQNGRFNDNMGGLGGSVRSTSRHQLRASMSIGQLGQYSQGARAVSGTNLIGAAGNYGNANGMNPVFATPNPFGNGYNGGFMQQPQYQQASPFVSGSLLGQGGGFGAFGGGIGAAGFHGGMPATSYGVQAGGVPIVGGQQTDRVERWRQGIR
ncbi:hypothetical protein M406DRAFT_351266 [Cryphonectria parasitica EP155]|uniref:Uncharacterized protein n=1 Tax=Cryphonectria parasitica (strain ATCC 38755 / EP155) TaxID=660469 RepID=A0A9P5CQF8_CRYP1|nr:uncharacterized protein M406DRAFT_351266 [Cryphonectria parasitica EP155]KAF3765995.1 hypothetical protein M406DRAFT_351266 [Cryphonectria parasitica EP155]